MPKLWPIGGSSTRGFVFLEKNRLWNVVTRG
jgi:hypothetical protein